MQPAEYHISDISDLSEILKQERQKQDLTQRDLAKRSNVSPQMISAIEKNQREPTIGIVGMLAIALGVVIILGVISKSENGGR